MYILFGLRTFLTSTECSTVRANISYYLYYILKITKIYVKMDTSKIHQVMKPKT